MEHTKNYRLPQWERDDRIQMSDFNQMCRDLETGLTTAQQAADAAQAAADNARQTAGELPYVTGTYTGDGKNPHDISLGFMPQFVIISGQRWNYNADSVEVSSIGLLTRDISHGFGEITSTGFRVRRADPYVFPHTNDLSTEYGYIAFR